MKSSKRGFTLIEMLFVIAIIAVVTGIIIVSANAARSKARDAQRINDMGQISLALEHYYEKHHAYPASDEAGCGGWDTPGNATFIQALKTEGFLPNDMKDPSGDDNCGNYRYYRYVAGYEGCAAAPFYVLGIVDLEHSDGPDKASPGWACGSLDWQDGMEWVTGHYQ